MPIYNIIGLTIVAAGCSNRCRHCSMSAEPNAQALLSLDEIGGKQSSL